MCCPNCGTQNPETGRFCRSCGTDRGNVSRARTSPLPQQQQQQMVDHKGRPISIDRAIIKMFSGLAFIAVAVALAVTNAGRGWWFWMLIPAFMSLGTGVAQYMRIRAAERNQPFYNPTVSNPALGGRRIIEKTTNKT